MSKVHVLHLLSISLFSLLSWGIAQGGSDVQMLLHQRMIWEGFEKSGGRLELPLQREYFCQFLDYAPQSTHIISTSIIQFNLRKNSTYEMMMNDSYWDLEPVNEDQLSWTFQTKDKVYRNLHNIYIRSNAVTQRIYMELAISKDASKNQNLLQSQISSKEFVLSYGICIPNSEVGGTKFEKNLGFADSSKNWPEMVLKNWLSEYFKVTDSIGVVRKRSSVTLLNPAPKERQLGSMKVDSSAVGIAEFVDKGRGLIAKKNISTNTHITDYPIDILYDEKSDKSQLRAISEYGSHKDNEDEFQRLADYPKTSGTGEFDFEYAIGIYWKDLQYLAFPLNPKTRDQEEGQEQYLGHIINDAAVLEFNSEFILNPTQPAMDRIVWKYLNQAMDGVNSKVEPRALTSNEGQVYLRVIAMRPILKGQEIQFFYGPAYWLAKEYQKYGVLGPMQNRINEMYKDSAIRWRNQLSREAQKNLFWWIEFDPQIESEGAL